MGTKTNYVAVGTTGLIASGAFAPQLYSKLSTIKPVLTKAGAVKALVTTGSKAAQFTGFVKPVYQVTDASGAIIRTGLGNVSRIPTGATEAMVGKLGWLGKTARFLNKAAVLLQAPAATYAGTNAIFGGELTDLPDWVLSSYGLKKDQYGNIEKTGVGINGLSLEGMAGNFIANRINSFRDTPKEYKADNSAKSKADEARLKSSLFDRMEIISVDDKGVATALVKHEGGNGLMTLDKDGNIYNSEGKKFTLQQAVDSLVPLTDADRKQLTNLMTNEQTSTSGTTTPPPSEEYKYEDYLRTIDSLSISI